MGNDKPILSGKGRYSLRYRGTECLNCGHPLDISDRYCPLLLAGEQHQKGNLARDFLDEFLSSVVSYDSKLARTLGALLLRPGKITLDYINGKRVRYTNPFRFLLSLAIIYFLLIGYINNFEKMDELGAESDKDVIEMLETGTSAKVVLNDHGKEVTKENDSLGYNRALDKYLRKRKEKDSVIMADPTAYFKTIAQTDTTSMLGEKINFFYTISRNEKVKSFEQISEKYGIENTFGNRWSFAGAHGVLGIQRQPGTFVSSVFSKLPFATFFFLPVFAIFISLAYIRKTYNYTDHLIFSFHNQALLFILLTISLLIDAFFKVDSAVIFMVIFAVYLFIAMKRFYRQGFFKTLVKYLLLNAIFIILATFVTILMFTGSMFTF